MSVVGVVRSVLRRSLSLEGERLGPVHSRSATRPLPKVSSVLRNPLLQKLHSSILFHLTIQVEFRSKADAPSKSPPPGPSLPRQSLALDPFITLSTTSTEQTYLAFSSEVQEIK